MIPRTRRGSLRDRHQNIGAGLIGTDAFRELFAHPAVARRAGRRRNAERARGRARRRHRDAPADRGRVGRTPARIGGPGQVDHRRRSAGPLRSEPRHRTLALATLLRATLLRMALPKATEPIREPTGPEGACTRAFASGYANVTYAPRSAVAPRTEESVGDACRCRHRLRHLPRPHLRVDRGRGAPVRVPIAA